MRRYSLPLGLIFLAVTLSGCAGMKARQSVLLPGIQRVWPHIMDDAINSFTVDDTLLQAFNQDIFAGNIPKIGLGWPAIRSMALAGVDAESVSKGVKQSEVQRILMFDKAIHVLSGSSLLKSSTVN